jgi:hypothetical protein
MHRDQVLLRFVPRSTNSAWTCLGPWHRNLDAPVASDCVAGPRFTVTLQAIRHGENMCHVALRLGMPEHGHYRLGSKAVY